MTKNEVLATCLLSVQQSVASDVCSRAANRLLLLDKRVHRALDELQGMIDGDSPWDSQISNVIRILKGETV